MFQAQQFKPTPFFSQHNPYWHQTPIQLVHPEYQPRKTALDFLYAAKWEVEAYDVFGAHCVRRATCVTTAVEFRFRVGSQIREMLKEKRNEAIQ